MAGLELKVLPVEYWDPVFKHGTIDRWKALRYFLDIALYRMGFTVEDTKYRTPANKKRMSKFYHEYVVRHVENAYVLAVFFFVLKYLMLKKSHFLSSEEHLTLSQTSPCLQYKSFENTVGKGEIARNEQFLLFPLCFLPVGRTLCHFHQI